MSRKQVRMLLELEEKQKQQNIEEKSSSSEEEDDEECSKAQAPRVNKFASLVSYYHL